MEQNGRLMGTDLMGNSLSAVRHASDPQTEQVLKVISVLTEIKRERGSE